MDSTLFKMPSIFEIWNLESPRCTCYLRHKECRAAFSSAKSASSYLSFVFYGLKPKYPDIEYVYCAPTNNIGHVFQQMKYWVSIIVKAVTRTSKTAISQEWIPVNLFSLSLNTIMHISTIYN